MPTDLRRAELPALMDMHVVAVRSGRPEAIHARCLHLTSTSATGVVAAPLCPGETVHVVFHAADAHALVLRAMVARGEGNEWQLKFFLLAPEQRRQLREISR